MPTMLYSRTLARSEVQIMIIPLSSLDPTARDRGATPRRL
jgi:hypothetical protein